MEKFTAKIVFSVQNPSQMAISLLIQNVSSQKNEQVIS